MRSRAATLWSPGAPNGVKAVARLRRTTSALGLGFRHSIPTVCGLGDIVTRPREEIVQDAAQVRRMKESAFRI
jgi:hypothetical protein